MNNEIVPAVTAETAIAESKSEQYLGEMKLIAATAKRYAMSALVPEQYRGKEADCFIACEMAYRMGVPPLMVMQSLYVVKGKPQWSGQSCIAMVNNGKRFDSPLEFEWAGEQGNDDWGCRAYSFKDGKRIIGTLVNMAMVKGEGWISNSKWKNMPELMFQYRAAAFFARVYCPEVLMGCTIEGESDDSRKKTVTVIDPLNNKGEKE